MGKVSWLRLALLAGAAHEERRPPRPEEASGKGFIGCPASCGHPRAHRCQRCGNAMRPTSTSRTSGPGSL